MNAGKPLAASELYRKVDLDRIPYATTADVAPTTDVFGQE